MKDKKDFRFLGWPIVLGGVVLVGLAWYVWQSNSNSNCGTAIGPGIDSDAQMEYAQCSVNVQFESKQAAMPVLHATNLTYEVIYDHSVYMVSVTVPKGQEQHYVDYFSTQPGVKSAHLNFVSQLN